MLDSELDEKLTDVNGQYLQEQAVGDRIKSQLQILSSMPSGSMLGRDGNAGRAHSNGRAAPGFLSRRNLEEQLAGHFERLRYLADACEALVVEKERRMKAARVPIVAEQLRRATAAIHRHDLLAVGVQSALVMLHQNLVELNKSSDSIYQLVRELHPDDKGVASYASEFHPTFKPDRLRYPLAAALNVGQYGRLAKRPFLPNLKTSDFSVSESHVGRNLLTELQAELASLQQAEHPEPSEDVTLPFVEIEQELLT